MFGYDDALDVGSSLQIFLGFPSLQAADVEIQSQIFASHAVGGIVGNLLTAIFAQKSVAGIDGSAPIPGGFLDKHFVQMAWHLADSAAGFAWSFAMTVRLILPSFTPAAILTFLTLDCYPVVYAFGPRSPPACPRIDRDCWYRRKRNG